VAVAHFKVEEGVTDVDGRPVHRIVCNCGQHWDGGGTSPDVAQASAQTGYGAHLFT
jgi:hypothetical protein